MKKNILIILSIVLIIGLLAGVYFYSKSLENERPDNAGLAVHAPEKIEELIYKGTAYPLKKHIQTVLLIGTDNEGNETTAPEGFYAFYNFSQADFIMLLVVDQDTQKVDIIQFNRDTMTEVPWLDVIGRFGGTVVKQLCLSFNSGSGGPESCLNTLDSVSRLIYNAPIQDYIQIPMTAIPAINDLVGGVPVTIEDDMTRSDPALKQGITIRLSGKQAETFVRARMSMEDSTNIARMRRQRAYLDSFRQCAADAISNDPNFALKVMDQLDGYLQTSLSVQDLADLINHLNTYTISPIQPTEGELKIGEYYEFYVDDAALWNLVKTAYCQ